MTPIRPEPARHGRAHHGRLQHGGQQHDGQQHDGPVPRDAVSLDPVLLDDAVLESIAASLLCDDSPPPRVHEFWRRDHGAHDDADDPRRSILRAGKTGRSGEAARSGEAGPAVGTRMAPVLRLRRRFSATAPIAVTAAATAAAAAAVLLVAGAGIFPHPWTDAGDGPSQSQPAQPDIDLAALGPAVGAAMGERDLGGLDDPALADACLSAHDEAPDALLGAAPVAHGERVGQLFVLSTGIPGRVTVLLTLNTCGSEPGPPVVHEQIGAPG